MALQDITHTIPAEHKDKLLDGEIAYHFSFINYNANSGGCSGQPQNGASQWILISNKRVLYEGKVKEEVQIGGTKKVVYKPSSGSIPVKKISFVGRSTETQVEGCGCSPQNIFILKINSGGGVIEIAIPNEAESSRLQKIIEEIVSSDEN